MKLPTQFSALILFALTVALVLPADVTAHPGSGIVVDRHGNIYFVDTGAGVWKINRDGTLTRHPGPAFHWMAIDHDGRLANVSLPSFSYGGATVTRAGAEPTLLLASDFPIAVGRDGDLYYPWLGSGDRLQVFRLAPSGQTSVLVTVPVSTEGSALRWLNGIAAGPDGSIYYAENRAVRKITPQGQVSTLAGNISLTGCATIPEVGAHLAPFLRGLDVDAKGNVYVAASGCGSVLKISPDGLVTTILKTSNPWSPTAVAVFGTDLYVQEYLHTSGDDRKEWLPRVRKLSADGRVVTVAEIKKR